MDNGNGTRGRLCDECIGRGDDRSDDRNSLICAEILGLNGKEKAASSYVASPRTAEYYKKRPCAAKVESAARIFAEYYNSVHSI